MDELKEMWKAIESDRFSNSIPTKENIVLDQLRPNNQIEKLRFYIKVKLGFTIVIAFLFTAIIPFLGYWPTQILLAILTVAYIVGGYMLYKEYQVLKQGLDPTLDLKHALYQYLSRVKFILRTEERVVFYLLPISLSAGFLFGAWLGSGYDDQHLSAVSFWLTLAAAMTVLMPISHWLGKWMNRVTFGKVIRQVEDLIEELEKG